MKINKRMFLFLFTCFLMVFFGLFFVNIKIIGNKKSSVINISNLSEEFMDNYFEKYNEIATSYEKANILIVTSTKKLNNIYGATSMIPAPNNQYILQFDTASKRDKAFEQLKNSDSILNVDENQIMKISENSYNSWGIDAMGLSGSIEGLNTGGLNDVHVAIIDTGCDVNLVNKYYPGKISESYNALNNSTTISDTNGHGTHIAGTIAEGTPSNVKIVPVKASTGSDLWMTDIILGINYIVYYDKADVLNMSFSSYTRVDSLYNAIEAANQKGIITVAAAGNENSSSWSYPAAFDNTISISSVDSSLQKSSFSNYGSTIDFAAPGTLIKSTLGSNMELSKNTDGDNDFETISGTSMATPHAANAVALLKSYNNSLTKDNVIHLLKTYAVKDLGELGKDKYYGNGFLYFYPNSFCTSTDDCEEFHVFKRQAKISPVEINVSNVMRTSMNYATVNNFNPTEIKITLSNGNETILKLGDLSGVEIIGYDPYAVGEQNITISWQGLETSFKFTNPDNWNSGWTYETIGSGKIKLTGFQKFNVNSAAKKLYIPQKIDGFDVVEIANDSMERSIFYDDLKSTYEELILPSTLLEISGNNTFKDFQNIEKVSSTSNSLKITGENVFANNHNLVEINATISKLGKNAFADNNSLQYVSLADSITDIPYGAFYACSSLTNINLPSSLKSIGFKAFQDSGLFQVILPNNVETIDDYAFYQSDEGSIVNVSLSSKLKTIGKYAFSGSLIEEIELPNSLETIGAGAFANNIKLKSFYLPKNVTSIGSDLLLNSISLETIQVASENINYDSRNNCNAIIEKSTNTLLCGSKNTVIPNNTKKIANNAFYGIIATELTIPDGVEEIGNTAFYKSTLEKLFVPSSVTAIGNNAFIGKDNKIPIWINTNSYAKTYAVNNAIPYEATNSSYITISLTILSFQAFDKVSTDAYVYFDRGIVSANGYSELKKSRGRKETISAKDLQIIYPNNHDSFRYGDTSFTIKGITQYGENFEKSFNVTISKLIPTYTIPSGLTANVNQTLSDVSLPSGFEWTDSDMVLENVGDFSYKARYIPDDTQNYEIVDNIDIPISVKLVKTKITPNIIVGNKIYDGTVIISNSNVVVSNLLATDYIIKSAVISNPNVGNRVATISLKLSDEKFQRYTFDNGLQEMDFTTEITVTPKMLAKPVQLVTNYTYSGVEINFELQGYDNNTMTISNNKGLNAGKYQVVVSLKNNNYLWDDNGSSDINFNFEIDKANLDINDLSSDVIVKYDGKGHSINVNLQADLNFVIKYMNKNGEYSLDEIPKYSEIGTYITKYKAYVNDNYTEYFGQKALTIEENINNYVINDYSVDEVNKYISKIMTNTDETAFKNHFTLSGDYSVKVDVKELNGKKVLYTGGKTKIMKGSVVCDEYTNAVIGDINGDGLINSADLLKIRQHLLGINVLSGVHFLASDINYDSQINSADLLRMRQHLLGVKPIQ